MTHEFANYKEQEVTRWTVLRFMLPLLASGLLMIVGMLLYAIWGLVLGWAVGIVIGFIGAFALASKPGDLM